MEPVDRDALRRPPRSMGDSILNRALILKVLMSAAVIIGGTLFIFWREVSKAGIGSLGISWEPCAGLTDRHTHTHELGPEHRQQES